MEVKSPQGPKRLSGDLGRSQVVRIQPLHLQGGLPRGGPPPQRVMGLGGGATTPNAHAHPPKANPPIQKPRGSSVFSFSNDSATPRPATRANTPRRGVSTPSDPRPGRHNDSEFSNGSSKLQNSNSRSGRNNVPNPPSRQSGSPARSPNLSRGGAKPTLPPPGQVRWGPNSVAFAGQQSNFDEVNAVPHSDRSLRC